MNGLAFVWRWWTDTWRAPGRARLLYGAMALAFAALAAVAALQGEAAVAAIAGIATAGTLALAALAPQLRKWTEG
jgi:hypothetical protein